jgi:hypothetical protein
MNKLFSATVAAAACVMAVGLTASDASDAAGSVTTTKDDCMNAWATLMASHPSIHGAFPHTDYKEAITNVIKNHPHWTLGGYEPGISQKFELVTFDTRFHEGGTAYVAHCGHGATCNALAEAVYKAYPSAGSPVVFCTVEPPHILDNPQGM